MAENKFVVMGLYDPLREEVVIDHIRKKKPLVDRLISALRVINPYYRRVVLFEGTPEEIKLKGYEIGVRFKFNID